MAQTKRTKGSATIILLLSLVFVMGIFLFQKTVEYLNLKLYFYRKKNQLKLQKYITKSTIRHKIRIKVPLFLLKYVKETEQVPSTEVISNYVNSILPSHLQDKAITKVEFIYLIGEKEEYTVAIFQNTICWLSQNQLRITISLRDKIILSQVISLTSILEDSPDIEKLTLS